jgi:hypothetical protein
MRRSEVFNWKIVELIAPSGAPNDGIAKREIKLGLHTAYTAHGRMIKRYPSYTYVPRDFHLVGGYFTSAQGDTAELALDI